LEWRYAEFFWLSKGKITDSIDFKVKLAFGLIQQSDHTDNSDVLVVERESVSEDSGVKWFVFK
jgi:hypothetical protein